MYVVVSQIQQLKRFESKPSGALRISVLHADSNCRYARTAIEMGGRAMEIGPDSLIYAMLGHCHACAAAEPAWIEPAPRVLERLRARCAQWQESVEGSEADEVMVNVLRREAAALGVRA